MQRLEQRNQDCGFQQHKTNSKTEAISIDKEKNIQKQLIGMNIVLIETIKCHTLITAYHSRKLSLFHNHPYSLIHLHLPLDSWTAMAASPRLTQWGTYIWSTRFHPQYSGGGKFCWVHQWLSSNIFSLVRFTVCFRNAENFTWRNSITRPFFINRLWCQLLLSRQLLVRSYIRTSKHSRIDIVSLISFMGVDPSFIWGLNCTIIILSCFPSTFFLQSVENKVLYVIRFHGHVKFYAQANVLDFDNFRIKSINPSDSSYKTMPNQNKDICFYCFYHQVLVTFTLFYIFCMQKFTCVSLQMVT